MENLLDLYERPKNKAEPVVCIDERPVVLHDSKRPETAGRPGRVARKDYEYKRCGTANVFCIVEPKAGRHLTHATENRKRPAFAQALQRIAAAYPRAKTIHLVLDNLNTHNEKSLLESLGAIKGARLWSRFSVHYTPYHASWLNQAEIAISLWSRECLGKRRMPTLEQLTRETEAWTNGVDAERRTIDWRFTSKTARKRFRYKGG
jgi:hypothetical protein